MNKSILLIFAVLFLTDCNSQTIPSKNDMVTHFGVVEHKTKNGVSYYSYSKGTTKKTKLVLYLQGTDPSPQFSYQIKNGTTQFNCFFNREFKNLTEDYIYAVIEKTGFEGVFDESRIKIPEIYIKLNSLDNRVSRANSVINELNETYRFSKIIVYGHSEGAPIAAKLATVNKKITHLGFWAGNALPDFYDFILENRIRFYKGDISDAEAQTNIDDIIDGFVNDIAKDTLNTDSQHYTKKRWWSYAEPPINNLLKIDIPIYVQVASLDKSAPVESTYLIPLEFARLKKKNLTYKVCVGCDHGFTIKNQDGTTQRLWNDIFQKFLKWTEGTYGKR